ncbi:ead/Ea22-like family protein [Escherichia coli]|nr:ead/Ea22-like family protein [Escherichia coli]
MSNINKQALRESAESTIGILENIAGFEPSDIDGDTVELRFETEGGFDTGCDVSIVDQCQKAADVVRALLDELEASQSYAKERDEENQDLMLTVGRLRVERETSEAEMGNALCQLLPGCHYMDPPDGGNVTPLEQVRRMVSDYRERIAELGARELVVNLPAYVDGRTLGYGEVNHMIDLCADAIEKAGHAAGIITKVGE